MQSITSLWENHVKKRTSATGNNQQVTINLIIFKGVIIYENKKNIYFCFYTLHSIMLTACSGKDTVPDSGYPTGTPQTEVSTKASDQAKPALNLQIPPAQNWMIYISRKTSFLQIMQMYGTRYLA